MKSIAILLSVLAVFAPCPVSAQKSTSVSSSSSSSVQEKQVTTKVVTENPKKVSVKISPTSIVSLRNRFGPIVITGTDGDTMEASVTSDSRTLAAFKVGIASEQKKDKISLAVSINTPDDDKPGEKSKESKVSSKPTPDKTTPKPDKMTPKPPPTARPISQPAPGAQGTRSPSAPRPTRPARPATPAAPSTPLAESLRGVREIRLDIKIPRDARIELIDSRRFAIVNPGADPTYLTNTRNDVTVSGLTTPVSIVSSGNVRVWRVAAVEVQTRAGSVYVEDVAGPIDVKSVTGGITVREAGGDVRAVSITGPVGIDCARGRVEASTTNSLITLKNLGGDLEAVTSGGEINFSSPIREGGRYRLKSMSGSVRMMIQPDPPGFTAIMSSYQGEIAVDFDLRTDLSPGTPAPDTPMALDPRTRRMMGHYGNGEGRDARITLDSFSGAVRLGKAQPAEFKKCR